MLLIRRQLRRHLSHLIHEEKRIVPKPVAPPRLADRTEPFHRVPPPSAGSAPAGPTAPARRQTAPCPGPSGTFSSCHSRASNCCPRHPFQRGSPPPSAHSAPRASLRQPSTFPAPSRPPPCAYRTPASQWKPSGMHWREMYAPSPPPPARAAIRKIHERQIALPEHLAKLPDLSRVRRGDQQLHRDSEPKPAKPTRSRRLLTRRIDRRRRRRARHMDGPSDPVPAGSLRRILVRHAHPAGSAQFAFRSSPPPSSPAWPVAS